MSVLLPSFVLALALTGPVVAAEADPADRVLDALLRAESLPSPYYEHFDVSPDGRFVAFTVERGRSDDDAAAIGDLRKLPGGIPATFLRQDVWIADRQTGSVRHLTDGRPQKRSSWHPIWSRDGRRLAFYGDRDGRIALWIAEDAGAERGRVRAIEGVEIKAALFRWDVPRFLPDGRTLVVPVLPEVERGARVEENPLYRIPALYKAFLDPRGGPSADVLRSGDESAATRFLTEENRADLAAVDATSGTARLLTSGLNVQLWELSPDGRRLAFKVLKRLVPGRFQRLYDLHVVDVAGGAPRRLAEEVEGGILWSPDGALLLERKQDQLLAVDAATGEARTLTPASGFERVNAQEDVLQLSINSFLWAPGGQGVLARNKDGWWLLPRAGGEPRKLFSGAGPGLGGVLRASRHGQAASPDGRTVLVETFDSARARKGLARASLERAAIEPLAGEVPTYSQIYETFGSGSEAGLLYSVTGEEATDLFVSDLAFTRPLRLTTLNPHLRDLPRTRKELIEYRGLGGQPLKGALLLPPGYEKGRRYPLVAYVYAGSVVRNLEDEFRLSFSPVGSIPHMLAARGFVVLRPSIPLTPEGSKSSPLLEIPQSVLPAVERVVEAGIADPDRLGVIGQSYGGYTTNVLITQTRRFRAAVAMAGLSDLVSHYGTFDARQRHSAGWGPFHSSWAEGGQGRMGGPLWDDPMHWIENSPVFHLDRVSTPLLLLHGDLDSVPVQQAEEIYSGLKRLGKDVEFVRYFGEGHVLSKPANIRDSWRRIADWFDRHLAPSTEPSPSAAAYPPGIDRPLAGRITPGARASRRRRTAFSFAAPATEWRSG